MQQHTKIFLALATGAVAGVAVNLAGGGPATSEFVRLVTEPLGKMWLAGLIMIVIPLIFSTISLGVAGLGDVRRLGKVGLVTLVSFLVLTALGSTLGLVMTHALNPGAGLDPAVKTQLMEAYQGAVRGAMGLSGNTFGIDLLVNLVPRNPVKAMAEGDMLGLIVFSLMVGLALTMIPKEKAKPMVDFLDSLAAVTTAIITFVMKLAPYGVFCLIFSVTARFGYDLLVNLLLYVVTVVVGLLLLQTVGYAIVLRLFARRNPVDFLRKQKLVMVTAFSTSSSNATLPTALRVGTGELGIPKSIAGFVLPLGATMNQNGTALFGGATVLFLAQVFGIDLSIGQQVVVVLMCVVAAIGTAGVPSGSIPLIMMVLGMVGVPVEGIAIVLGVDRVLDMCRTVPNVTGDLVAAAVVERFEGTAARTADV